MTQKERIQVGHRKYERFGIGDFFVDVTDVTAHEPDPIPNDKPAVWDLVIRDMQDRDRIGAERYGTRLQPHNGRDVLIDAYQEALDLAVYLRQAIYERDEK